MGGWFAVKFGGLSGLNAATRSAHRFEEDLHAGDAVFCWNAGTYGCADCCVKIDGDNVVVDVEDMTRQD